MANLSSAYGQMALTGEWTDELICALDRFAQNVWSEWCYDITPGEFSPDVTCVDFYANGRYSLQYSLKTLGECSLEDSKDEKVISRYPQAADDHSILISGMEARGLGIGLNFVDEESGCEVLYAQQGVITAKDGQFTYTIIENTDYDFTWQNIFDLLDTGDEDFSLLSCSLCEEIGIDPDDKEKRAAVDKWAMEKTFPYVSEFDSLNDKTQAAFIAAFGDSTDK
jgi:hypothetical protein